MLSFPTRYLIVLLGALILLTACNSSPRTAIARAVVCEPALLLADEPTGPLDSQSGEGVMRLLLDLNARGTTIVVITHEHMVASRLPRQVSMLDGRVVDDRTAVRL